MEKKQTTTKRTTRRKKTENDNQLYHVSWCGNSAEYSRTFNSENEREYFIKNYIGDKKVNTWESERGCE